MTLASAKVPLHLALDCFWTQHQLGPDEPGTGTCLVKWYISAVTRTLVTAIDVGYD